MKKNDLLAHRREIETLQKVDHPNIIKYYETYNNSDKIYLCMELCKGGHLSLSLKNLNGPMGEKEASKIIAKLLRAL